MNDGGNADEINNAIDKIFETELVSRQINFLRQVLLEFIKNNLNKNHSKAATYFSIDRNTLQRFVENNNLDNQEKDFYSSPKTLKAIVRVLARPDVGALQLNELIAGQKQHLNEAKHLLHFFAREEIHFDVKHAGKFEQVLTPKRRSQNFRQLTFSANPNESIFDVTEEVISVRLGGASSDEHESPSDKSVGWAVFIRDNLLLALLRDDVHQESHSYVSMTNPQRDEATDKVRKLILVEHKNLTPVDWDTTFSLSDDILQTRLCNNMIEFQRVEVFSSSKPKEGSIMEKRDSDGETSDARNEGKKKGANPFRGNTRFQKSETELAPAGSRKGTIMADTLGKQLNIAAKNMDIEQVKELLGQGAPVDYVEPSTGATAVHHAAGRGDWETLDALLDTGKCNLLIRDRQGRLASRLAAEFRGNMQQAERLMDLEKAQGVKVGINPTISGDKPITPGCE